MSLGNIVNKMLTVALLWKGKAMGIRPFTLQKSLWFEFLQPECIYM